MRIAVITFFQSQTNYGQLLQAFALQQILMRMGHFPYIIRYGFHENLPIVLTMDVPQKDNGKLLGEHQWQETEKGTAADRFFDKFREKHLNLSKNAYNNLRELQIVSPIADCYLVGSDQVWAQLLSYEGNRTFFLDFGPDDILRIAYAPSFSLSAYPEELNDVLSQNLERFQAISVREKTGVDICRKAGKEAKWVVDPTMLLSGDDYRLLGEESQTELLANYMLVYHVNVERKDFTCWNAFKQYNAEHGIRAVAVHANGENQLDVEFLEDAKYLYPTIQDWIRLIDGSQYVLTTSFHGMIFAILLHKPFFVLLRPESMFAGNDRILTILSELGLENFIVTDSMNFNEAMQRSICWEEVDKKLSVLRSSSITFLEEALSNGKSFSDDAIMRIMTQHLTDRWYDYVSSKTREKQERMHLQQMIDAHEQQLSAIQDRNEYLNKKKKRYLRLVRLLAIFVLCLLTMLVIMRIHR
ncbi:MAG: polysaccharide pyruvyl transferase family protein [Bacteroidaceae bacterium]|nr:polysaccharide pyruvyl transferase family protein [Bacteroidaceae bacterium]